MDKEKVSTLVDEIKGKFEELCGLIEGEKKEISSLDELRDKASEKKDDEEES